MGVNRTLNEGIHTSEILNILSIVMYYRMDLEFVKHYLNVQCGIVFYALGLCLM